METSFDNPCVTCSIGQDCCKNLSGLMLTESEYEQHFARHRETMLVEKKGPMYEVSVKDGKPCPYWNDGCEIYTDRPMDCRLFPYCIDSINHDHGRLLLTVNSQTPCPQKSKLLLPEGEVVAMVSSFARGVFGNDSVVEVEVEHETLLTRLKRRVKDLIARTFSSATRPAYRLWRFFRWKIPAQRPALGDQKHKAERRQ